jgi:hypothetical protein
MGTKRGNRLEVLDRVKEALVEGWLALSDQELLHQVSQEGFEPADEARSRVLEAYQRAKKIAAADERKSALAEQPKKPAVLSIDAARARAILMNVASRAGSDLLPLRNAAQLNRVQSDEEAIKAVGELRDLGIVSDEELK